MFRRGVILLTIWLSLGCHLSAAPTDPAALQIRIAEGDGLTYPIGSRATRGITIEVTDDAGKAVDGATVTFRLPETGPGGTFSDGSKTAILTTHADGRASAWGMKWNRQAGAFDVRITVTKGQVRAGTVCSQHLAEAPGPVASKGGGSSHRWLWIALAAAGAGAGIAVAALDHGGSSSGCSATVVLLSDPCATSPSSQGTTQIGTPTINLGHP